MPDTTVRYFHSSMSGAPVLSGSAGSLITVLDACLVNGFGSVTLDSLVVASNVATATVSGGHNLAMVGEVGPVVRIEEATPSGLNGDWRVTVTSSTVFTFATTGISDQTASGTITAKRAPAGFEKAFTGTNKAAYRSLNAAGTQLYLRIDDTGTTSAAVIMYEAMSDIDTGTGLSPTSGSLSWIKGDSAPWGVVADDRAVYLMTYNNYYGAFFGDIVSFIDPDPYGAGLISSNYFYNMYATYESYLARTWTGVGNAVGMGRETIFPGSNNRYIGGHGVPFPNPPDHAFHAAPVFVIESVLRGTMPGLWNPLHPYSQLQHQLLVPLTVNGVARQGLIWVFSNAAAAFDLTGPWR